MSPYSRKPMGWLAGAAALAWLSGCQEVSSPAEETPVTYLEAEVDLDGDGHGAHSDCDDRSPSAYPGAPETPYDGVDQDCDGADALDVDGDGFFGGGAGGPDCDDTDPAVHPGAADVAGDGVDQDCDGNDSVDEDLDGYSPDDSTHPDCDDTDPSIHPAATELQDGVDNNCDGRIDEAPYQGELQIDQAGLTLHGQAEEAWLGSAVSLGGDLDRDGLADLLVGVPGLAQVWLVRGDRSLWREDGLAVSASFQGELGDGVGMVLAPAGDLDGDGWADPAFGAPGASSGAGQVYLLLGSSSLLAKSTSLAAQAVALYGTAAGDGVGQALAGGRDATGDGRADLVIGAPGVDRADRNDAGAVYLYAGQARTSIQSGELSTHALAGFYGSGAGDGLGAAVGLSDLDGDQVADLLLGAPGQGAEGDSSHAGQLVLFYGPVSRGETDAVSADARFQDDDVRAGEAGAGSSLAACDVNGDGWMDLLMGAPGAGSSQVSGRGRVYYFAGSAERFNGDVTLSKATGSFLGASAGDRAGSSLACAGDVNGDGYADVLVGAPGREDGRGAAYLIYGSPAGWPAQGLLGQGTPVVRGGGEGARVGAAVAGGDASGDGLAELLIGAPNQAGAVAGIGLLSLFPGER